MIQEADVAPLGEILRNAPACEIVPRFGCFFTITSEDCNRGLCATLSSVRIFDLLIGIRWSRRNDLLSVDLLGNFPASFREADVVDRLDERDHVTGFVVTDGHALELKLFRAGVLINRQRWVV